MSDDVDWVIPPPICWADSQKAARELYPIPDRFGVSVDSRIPSSRHELALDCVARDGRGNPVKDAYYDIRSAIYTDCCTTLDRTVAEVTARMSEKPLQAIRGFVLECAE